METAFHGSELTSLFCFEVGASPGFIGPGKTDQSGHGVSGGGNSEGKAESRKRIAHSQGRERQTGIAHTFTDNMDVYKAGSFTFLASFSKQISELESEKQHLSEAVASLQGRAQSNTEERVREVEAENRLLLQNITDTSSRVASLETQTKLANEEASRLKEKAERCEEMEREVARLERSKEALSREVGNGSTETFSQFQKIEAHFTEFFWQKIKFCSCHTGEKGSLK